MKELLLCLFVCCCLPAFARQDSSRHAQRWNTAGRADKMGDKLKRELKLTKNQDARMRVINDDIMRRSDSIKHIPSLPQREKMQQLQGLSAERNQRFKTVLTAAQYKKFNDWDMQKKEQLEAKMDRKAAAKQAAPAQ